MSKWMIRAMEVAKQSGVDCPIGCVIIQNNIEIASSANMVERSNNPIAHAELICIKNACQLLNTKYLSECDLYCTLEPCEMCKEAIRLAKIKNVVFGAFRKQNIYYNNFVGGILENECSELLQNFFTKIRIT